jgi:hypothetical protein
MHLRRHAVRALGWIGFYTHAAAAAPALSVLSFTTLGPGGRGSARPPNKLIFRSAPNHMPRGRVIGGAASSARAEAGGGGRGPGRGAAHRTAPPRRCESLHRHLGLRAMRALGLIGFFTHAAAAALRF